MGLPPEWTADDIAISPIDADEALAGGKNAVHRTTNGGEVWEKSSFDFADGTVGTLAVADAATGLCFAGVHGGAAPGIKRSTDGGTSWGAVGENLGTLHVSDLAVHPSPPAVILAATSAGVAKSTDSGVTWSITDPTPTRVLSWSASPARIYGIVSGEGISVSVDGGETFEPVGAQPCRGGEILAATLVDEMELVSAGTGYCGVPGLPVSPVTTKIYRSENGGDSWSLYYMSAPANVGGSPLELALDPSPRIYLGEHGDNGGGLLRDTGVAVTGIRNYSVADVCGDELGTNYTLWEGPAGSLVKFEGAGENAVRFPSVFAGANTFWRVFHASQQDPGLLFDMGYFAYGDIVESYYLRSSDGGETWINFNAPGNVDEIATNHGTGQVVYIRAGTHFGRSTNDGESFEPAGALPGSGPWNPYLNPVSPQWTVLDAQDPMHLFTIGHFSVYESIDGAETWIPRDSGLPMGTAATAVALFMRPTDAAFLQVVYSDGGIHRSTDGGGSWTKWSKLPLRGAQIVDASWDPETGHVFAATSGSGIVSTLVLVSDSAGEASGLPDSTPTSVHFSPVSGLLYVGTSNAGLYHRRITFPASQIATDRNEVRSEPASRILISPNPMRDGTTIHFAHDPTELHVKTHVDVFDMRGRRVRDLALTNEVGGEVRVEWDGLDERGTRVPSGVYFVRFRSGSTSQVEKVVVLR